MTPVEKRDWKEIVAKSNGQAVFVPDALVEDVKKWAEQREAFNKIVNDIAQKENGLKVTFTNVMYKLQEYFAENGKPEIWSMDMGFNTEALKEGVYILNVQEPRKM